MLNDVTVMDFLLGYFILLIVFGVFFLNVVVLLSFFLFTQLLFKVT